jgi:hypothetical protein
MTTDTDGGYYAYVMLGIGPPGAILQGDPPIAFERRVAAWAPSHANMPMQQMKQQATSAQREPDRSTENQRREAHANEPRTTKPQGAAAYDGPPRRLAAWQK